MYLKYYLPIISLLICLLNVSCKTNGFVVTNTNDMIRGTFDSWSVWSGGKVFVYYGQLKSGRVFTAYNGKKIIIGQKAQTDIEIDSIDNFNVINKRKRDTSIYIYAGEHFWQRLAVKGSLSIYARKYEEYKGVDYDPVNHISVDQYLNYENIAIFSNKRWIVNICAGVELYSPSLKKNILKFINSTYWLNLTDDEFNNYIDPQKDFAHQKKLFDFILDNEIKLEQQGK